MIDLTKQLTSISRELRTIGRSLAAIGAALGMGDGPLGPLAAVAAARPERRRPQKLKLSAERRAALKLQGQYMGHIRLLKPRQKAQVRAARASHGTRAAIALAKRLSKH
jgi:hypothetical protein